MSEYLVLQQADGVYRQVAHPGYLDGNGELASHSLLKEQGFYLATDTLPEVDERYQTAKRNPSDQWIFDHEAKTVTITYTVVDTPNAFEEYKAHVRRQIDGWVAKKTVEGVTVTTPANGEQVIQTRHLIDNMNLLTVFSKATSRLAANDTTPCHLRTEANVTLDLSPTQTTDLLNRVFDAIETVYRQGWTAKEELDGLSEGADIVVALDAVDAVYAAL